MCPRSRRCPVDGTGLVAVPPASAGVREAAARSLYFMKPPVIRYSFPIAALRLAACPQLLWVLSNTPASKILCPSASASPYLPFALLLISPLRGKSCGLTPLPFSLVSSRAREEAGHRFVCSRQIPSSGLFMAHGMGWDLRPKALPGPWGHTHAVSAFSLLWFILTK